MLIKINLTIALDFNADAKESLDLNQFCRKKNPPNQMVKLPQCWLELYIYKTLVYKSYFLSTLSNQKSK